MIGRRWLGAMAACAMLLLPTTAKADGFYAQNAFPPTDPHGYITLNGARTLVPAQPHAAVYVNWANKPLRFEEAPRRLIEDMTLVHLVLGVGLLPIGDHGGVSVGVDVPIVADLHGTRLDEMRRLSSGKLADMRIDVKATLFDREEDAIGAFALMYGFMPTGRARDFTSNKDRITLGWVIGLEKEYELFEGRGFRIGGNVGYEWINGQVRIGDVTVDDKLLFGVAAGFELVRDLWLMAEVHHWTRAAGPWETRVEGPIEAGGALKYEGDLFVLISGSSGLNRGVGAPDGRAFGAIGFTF